MAARTTGPAAAPTTAPTASQSGLNTPDILADAWPARDPRFVRVRARSARFGSARSGVAAIRSTSTNGGGRRAYTVNGGGEVQDFVPAERRGPGLVAYLLDRALAPAAGIWH